MAKQKNIARKDGRVQVQIDIGVDPKTGNRRRKSFYGATTKEAQAKADAFKRDIENGYDAMTSDMRFDKWSDKWFKAYKKDIAYGTAQNYLNATATINDEFGNRKLKELTHTDLTLFANSLSEYSSEHIRFMRTTLNQILRSAVQNGLLVRNPADGVKWPAGYSGTHRVLESYEIEAIKTYWMEHRAGIWMMIMLLTGLRPGEMMALRWDDVDLKQQELHVRNAVHFEGNTPVLGPTKTKAALRTIPIPDQLLEALMNVRAKRTSLYVCSGRNGQLITKSTKQRGADSFCTLLSQRTDRTIKFQPYDLRHTFCTFLYDAEIDVKSAQYIMGHTDIKLTLQVYTHISDSRKQNYATKLKSITI